MIWLPSVEYTIEVHNQMIIRTGGDMAIRDIGLIESALARASVGFGDYELYPTVEAKAAAIGHGLASNHGFVDGNKRVGMAMMLIVLRKNAIRIECTDDDIVRLGLDVAIDRFTVDDVNRWIEDHKVM